MYQCILFIGTGQIGKAILKMIVENNPQKIIVHNLTRNESEKVIKKYSSKFPNIDFISSYGNIFMPYFLRELDNKNLYKYSDEIIDYFYSEITNEILEKSTIYNLIDKYNPNLIIDAINSATVLGNAYDPQYYKECFENNAHDCCRKLLVDDYTTKLINFVYSLKYSMEKYNTRKYIKVSTTGIGGMGMNMPYTHGDNPKISLSNAVMGKISAAGVLHQLLWNLSHSKGLDISLVIPATFVGYDTVKIEPIETEKGLLKKRNLEMPQKIRIGNDIKYNDNISKQYLEFSVVRAGENHVYSQKELNVLTALGQMEAITKEEVAQRVIDCINGNNSKNIFTSMDNAMLAPTYSGREMIYEINKKIKKEILDVPGISTGNLGVTVSKQLYELYLLKKACPTIKKLKNTKTDDIIKRINGSLEQNLLTEIITLGIPVLTNKDELYIGDYTLIPSAKESKVITEENLRKWTKVGWVDLRKSNIENWQRILIEIYENAINESEKSDDCIERPFMRIKDDYDIEEYLAYFNNMKNNGRKK